MTEFLRPIFVILSCKRPPLYTHYMMLQFNLLKEYRCLVLSRLRGHPGRGLQQAMVKN